MSDKRKSSYSWKTPWAFNSLYQMRRTLTERFVYKKLGLLERHSSFKKPYRQRSPHKIGELDFSYKGWPFRSPGAPGPFKPAPVGCVGIACNDVMLDCEGGCTLIPCTCITGLPIGSIAWDDTGGKAFLGRQTVTGVEVCVEDATGQVDEEYPTIGVNITDAKSSYVVTVSVVDCDVCCDVYTVTPDKEDTDPSEVVTFTIDPPCAGATITVVSNSGCTLPRAIDGAGAEATVTPGAADLGSFYVKIEKAADDDCDAISVDSVWIRINDTGQGGGWVEVDDFTAPNCGAGCDSPSCSPRPAPCIAGRYKFILGSMQCCCADPESASCGAPTWPPVGTCFTGSATGIGEVCYTGTAWCTTPPRGWNGEISANWTKYEWIGAC